MLLGGALTVLSILLASMEYSLYFLFFCRYSNTDVLGRRQRLLVPAINNSPPER
jgi:hypothetical protein